MGQQDQLNLRNKTYQIQGTRQIEFKEHDQLSSRKKANGGFWGFGGRSEPERCCYVMVEATTGFRHDPKSILGMESVSSP